MNPDEDRSVPLVAELIGWLAFVAFVVSVWKVRQTLDRRQHEP
jgi:hypothetical protein